MRSIIMQDWLTVRGVASGIVIQSQTEWILTAPFQDITFYLDVREVTGTVTIAYETCPARDDRLFQAMFTSAALTAATAAPQTIFASSNAVPVSHWSRWKLTGGAAAWDVTFRVMAAGNNIC
jgi:hypothetical protein